MTIEAELKDILMAAPDVRLLVKDRVTPGGLLPQASDYPALTTQIVSGDSTYSLAGPSNLASTRVQIDCYAETHAGAVALKAAVMRALSGFRHTEDQPGIVQGVFRNGETEAYEAALDKAGPRVWRKTIDFTIWHEECYA